MTDSASRTRAHVQQGPRARTRRHDWIDERSRALHAAVTEKLRRDPSVLRIWQENLNRWERLRGPQPAFQEWREIIAETPLPELLALLVEDSERANRLRQSSPFCGVLAYDERDDLLRSYEAL